MSESYTATETNTRDGLMAQDERYSEKMLLGSLSYPIFYRGALLLVVMAGGLLVGGQIERFEASLEAMIVLAFFIPVVMDMGGNIGTQSTTAFARGFAMGHVTADNMKRMVGRELFIGTVLGLVLGVVAATVATLWQGDANVGIAVGGALALGLPIATTLGFALPWALTRLGIDHVPASDPLMTTIKDFSMVTIYFVLATSLIGIELV